MTPPLKNDDENHPSNENDDEPANGQLGEENGQCYGNGTCNDGLTCKDNICHPCASQFEYHCHDDDVWWYDECGTQESIKETCVYGCVDGKCINC